MIRRTLLAAAVLCGVGFASQAADPGVSGEPSAHLTLTAKAAAVGVGYTWGDGELLFEGQKHHFSVKGISVADVGFSTIEGRGRVYHLKKLADFSGTYASARGEATVGHGLAGSILQNTNGVMIRIDEVTEGARLSGSANGVQLTLTD